MDQVQNADALTTIAAETFGALRDTRQVALFSLRPGGLTIDEAYRVTPLVRQMYEAHGSKVLGRKIGFTNRTIWTQYGVYAPIWGYVFDSTAYDLAAVETLSLEPFSEPRIEPEIIFGLKMEASVDPQCRGPDWMPITPKTGSLFHAETQ
jgi:2-oxo-3-hexenedioate decarboxylase